MNIDYLATQTSRMIEPISRLDCLKPFVLVGGTALSLQIHHRQSEDLDFMRWKENKSDSLDIGWPKIKKELSMVGNISEINILGFDQAIFIVEGVKLSFYAAPRKRIPTMSEVPYLNNIRLADIASIGIMKMEAMMRRSAFRDYYDIYSILREGVGLDQLIPKAIEHSGFRLKTKNLISILSNGYFFRKDEDFSTLHPIYDVSSADIELYIRSLLSKQQKLDDAVSVFIERAKDPRARSFSPEGSQILDEFFNQFVLEEKNKELEHLLDLCKDAAIHQNIPHAWIEDAIKELAEFANGNRRTPSNGLKR